MPVQTLWSRRSALLAALLLAVGFLQGGQAALAAADAEAAPDKKPSWDVNKPPGAAGTVTLDTRTGTWMSVDVSPDGKSLVFDLLGDLYLLPIAWEHQSSRVAATSLPPGTRWTPASTWRPPMDAAHRSASARTARHRSSVPAMTRST